MFCTYNFSHNKEDQDPEFRSGSRIPRLWIIISLQPVRNQAAQASEAPYAHARDPGSVQNQALWFTEHRPHGTGPQCPKSRGPLVQMIEIICRIVCESLEILFQLQSKFALYQIYQPGKLNVVQTDQQWLSSILGNIQD